MSELCSIMNTKRKRNLIFTAVIVFVFMIICVVALGKWFYHDKMSHVSARVIKKWTLKNRTVTKELLQFENIGCDDGTDRIPGENRFIGSCFKCGRSTGSVGIGEDQWEPGKSSLIAKYAKIKFAV